MKLKYLLLAISIGVGLSSCEEFLNTKPTNFIAPTYETLAELETGLAGVYDVLGSQALYGDVIPYWLNVSTDIGYTNTGQLNTTVYIYTPADVQVTNFWKTLYQGIYRANLVLARVDNPELEEGARNKIKGQALFLRGYYYFLLASNYGGVPLLLTAEPDINNVDVPRASLREVYDQVLSDMTQAESLVAEASDLDGGGRISRSAVQGILARVCITMAGYPLNDESMYEEAKQWAVKVRDSGMHELNPDYSDIFIKYAKDEYDIKESIWEVEFYGLLSNGSSEYTYYIGARGGILSGDVEIGYSGGAVRATKWLFDLYAQDETSTTTPLASPDLRRDWNIAPYTYVGVPGVATPNPDLWRRTMGKWRREYEVQTPKDRVVSPQNFPILRYSDVLLMIAEAENEIHGGPTVEAYDAINQVRRRAYGLMLSNPPQPEVDADLPDGLSKDEFFQEIINERAREFCFEAMRRPDYIRWGNFVDRMKEYKNWALSNGAVAGHVLAQDNISERNLLLPIPTYELSLNKAMTQNPGY
ncbi:RagB/SusD family nutrient uptake outer membrane protein [Sunxiuqinia elliptica]|uniref:Putative outer membrane starch-binding protein n=1 Tax=Sunxiuqinia elliptica TaxID=655355 RepID=A0A4R6HCA6_9BACT|nr:RagB/SusD family nutrient uptake outer membrane protein [Sunxiuqinia elliptica]TDO05411.1 putative outer membrane starch-binding protein [Sunxiuqinia elliptica]TDO64958.1 putative outer membrane starch-binding protein [Sunxiuqinia elliptica]